MALLAAFRFALGFQVVVTALPWKLSLGLALLAEVACILCQVAA